MPTPEHNPQSIPPSEIPPGWRLCRESEREKLPHDAKFWGCVHGQPNWLKESCCQGEALQDWEWKEYTYITAAPLPEGEREVPAASPWIPRSVREPVDKDFPVFLYADKPGLWSAKTQLRLCYRLSCMANFEFKDATHWQPAATKLPAPPPAPAKTQREKDEAAFMDWVDSKSARSSGYGRFDIYCAALITERAHFGGRSAEEVEQEIQLYHRAAAEARALLAHLEKGQRVCDERKADHILRMIACGEVKELRALLSPPKEGETP